MKRRGDVLRGLCFVASIALAIAVLGFEEAVKGPWKAGVVLLGLTIVASVVFRGR